MRDISLHILDIVENSINAGASKVEIEMVEDSKADRFMLRVVDDGKGMDEDLMKKIRDPFFSMKPGKKFGLGIPMLAQTAKECNGELTVHSEEGKGTSISAEYRLSHIDSKPLGDMGSTMAALVAGHSEVDYSLVYDRDGARYEFDTEGIKAELGDVPINLPDVLKFIKDDINNGIRRTEANER